MILRPPLSRQQSRLGQRPSAKATDAIAHRFGATSAPLRSGVPVERKSSKVEPAAMWTPCSQPRCLSKLCREARPPRAHIRWMEPEMRPRMAAAAPVGLVDRGLTSGR